jgi:hypothetical protein
VAVSIISVVTPLTRERIAREFDDRGPEACVAEVLVDMQQNNPELLDMARKCASSLENTQRVMMGFGMFYRLILAPATPDGGRNVLHPLPRVTPGMRDLLVKQIDEAGTEAFTLSVIDDLERSNPELLQMAHNFASQQPEYLPVMQGFALLYKALTDQAAADVRHLH